MTNKPEVAVPVWTIATAEPGSNAPAVLEDSLSPQRLADLRTALAAFADAPLVSLEAHPLPADFDRSGGIPLDAASPLARDLARLVADSAKAPAVANVEAAGEVLYRMVVPAKVAEQVGSGLMKPMVSKAVPGGIRSAIVGAKGVTSHASFVPVQTASAGAVGGAAGTAAATAATAGAITVAAPLVLMAVAAGVSAYADQQRQKAIEHITELLEKLGRDAMDRERSELDGCRHAIDKATAVLLDQGKVGASLGLDSAVHAISKASQDASRRVTRWNAALEGFGDEPVDIERLAKAFPGVDGSGGEFRAHLELAALTIALRRRVIVLQAVEHGQSDPGNPFENFVRSLRADQKQVDELEAQIASVVTRLANLRLKPSSKLSHKLMTRGEVTDLLAASYSLRSLGERSTGVGSHSDVVIEIAKESDGSILVLPAAAQ